MILWTIQSEEVYNIIMSEGVYRCDTSLAFWSDSLNDGYDWMADQMRKRIGNPPDGVVYPVWAHYQWEGERKKPDLRRERWANGWKGDPFVCMEIDIPDEEVLLSDFDAWSIILLNGLLSTTEDEDRVLEAQYEALSPKEQKAFQHKNWEAVFDLTPIDNEWALKGDSIQASFWELRKEEVKRVWFFKGAMEKPATK